MAIKFFFVLVRLQWKTLKGNAWQGEYKQSEAFNGSLVVWF